MPIYTVELNFASGCIENGNHCCIGDCVCPGEADIAECNNCCFTYGLQVGGPFIEDCACFNGSVINFDLEVSESAVFCRCPWLDDENTSNTEDGIPCNWTTYCDSFSVPNDFAVWDGMICCKTAEIGRGFGGQPLTTCLWTLTLGGGTGGNACPCVGINIILYKLVYTQDPPVCPPLGAWVGTLWVDNDLDQIPLPPYCIDCGGIPVGPGEGPGTPATMWLSQIAGC